MGDAYGHIQQMIVFGNYAENNAGLVLWIGDIAVPLFVLALLLARWRLSSNKRALETCQSDWHPSCATHTENPMEL